MSDGAAIGRGRQRFGGEAALTLHSPTSTAVIARETDAKPGDPVTAESREYCVATKRVVTKRVARVERLIESKVRKAGAEPEVQETAAAAQAGKCPPGIAGGVNQGRELGGRPRHA